MIVRALIFCAGFLLVACGAGQEPVSIIWTNERATGLIIHQLLADETDLSTLEVRLVRPEGDRSPVLGTFALAGDEITFTPVVPLTRGRSYELLEAGIAFGEIAIPPSNDPAPTITGIYPNVDILPENLLKVHLRFSHAMMEGRSSQYVKLIEDGKDTLEGTFLDLQPELWDASNKELTLWLDPGRIKLDLIPNQELGNPLKRGSSYRLVVLPGWRAKSGRALTKLISKRFTVGARDEQSPSLDTWEVQLPRSASREPLRIAFGEALDWVLAFQCIDVTDALGKSVQGAFTLHDDAKGFHFVPTIPWKPGIYSIVVESRLEDLAGNNLNRLFEVDLTKPGAKTQQQASTYSRMFTVK